MMSTTEKIKAKGIRNCLVICTVNPEWGIWRVVDDNGEWFDIETNRGGRILDYTEADMLWEVLEN